MLKYTISPSFHEAFEDIFEEWDLFYKQPACKRKRKIAKTAYEFEADFTDTNVTITGIIPGFNKSNIEITLEDRDKYNKRLLIKSKTEEDEKSFEKEYLLGAVFDFDTLLAKCVDGVLTITIDKDIPKMATKTIKVS